MNINDDKRLREGIRIALQHGPKFIVEKHLRDKCVFRVNVIDFENMAAVKRIPAHIVGDGTKTIQQLVDEKNQDPQRGEACSEDCSTFKLLITDRTHELLQEKGYTLGSVPKENELVFLQDKIILDIGADIEELSGRIHPDNRKLFTDIAKYFNLYLVGIDFLADDISVSWKDQGCAIIELNSMPYIDIHHHPTIGKSVNVGKYLAEMVDKHYFS